MLLLSKEVRQMIESERPRAICPFRIEPEGMGLAIVKGKLRYMNKTSSLIYSLSDGRHTVRDIVDRIKEQYPEVDEGTLFVDVLRMIRELQHLGMLNWKTIPDE